MKKELVFGLIILVLFSSFVIAQVNTSGLGNLNGAGEDVRGKSDEILSKEIEIPENLQFLARVVFGLKADDTVDLQGFVILIGLFVITLLLVKSILEVVPVVGGGAKAWAVGLIVTVLIAFAGGLQLMTGWILSISYLFGLLGEWGLLRFLVALVFLAGVFYLLSRVIKIVKTRTGIEEATRAGEDVGFVSVMGKTARETMKD